MLQQQITEERLSTRSYADRRRFAGAVTRPLVRRDEPAEGEP